MAELLAYNYVEIDNTTGMCIGVYTASGPETEGPTTLGTTIMEVPVNDPDYLFKYYINGNWYEDAAGTIPWTSSLL